MSPNHLPAEDRRFYKGKPLEYGEAHLAAAVAAAGGIPLMVYLAEQSDTIAGWAESIVAQVDALLLSGGEDIAPTNYGEAPGDPDWAGNPRRDELELALYRAALAADKPVLGVCRGAQLIGVAEGGSLWQDLPTLRPDTIVHRSQEDYDRLAHALEIDARASFLAALFDGEEAVVNSVHHQGLKDEPAPLRVIARAPDGVAECYVHEDAWVLGVQWHPEWMQSRPSQRRLFETFVAAARRPGERPW